MKIFLLVFLSGFISTSVYADKVTNNEKGVDKLILTENESSIYHDCLFLHEQPKTSIAKGSISTKDYTVNFSNKGDGKFLCSKEKFEIKNGELYSAKSDFLLFAFEGTDPFKASVLAKLENHWNAVGNIDNFNHWLSDFAEN